MSFIMTALLSSLVAHDFGLAAKSWLTYLPLLVALSVFISYLLLLILRRQAENIAQPMSPSPQVTPSRSTRLATFRSLAIPEDVEAQAERNENMFSITMSPSSVSPISTEGPSARITSPARIDSDSYNPPPVPRLHELSAFTEHK